LSVFARQVPDEVQKFHLQHDRLVENKVSEDDEYLLDRGAGDEHHRREALTFVNKQAEELAKADTGSLVLLLKIRRKAFKRGPGDEEQSEDENHV